ncbi:MAG: hypothetical protein R3C40_08875 [Parvularculaceae bacterium]|nr:hypothetical protein [Parvularculaceae bacterium]
MRLKVLSFAAALAVAGAANAQIAPLEPVETAALARDAFSTGLLTRAEGALGPDLWEGASPQILGRLLEDAPMRPPSPAVGDLLRRVLLSPGAGPVGAPASLGGAKLTALSRLGFWEQAKTIESLSSSPNGEPDTDEALAVADLLSGDVAAACQKNARLTRGRDAPFWVKLRVLCYAAANELDAAELALGLLREQNLLTERDNAIMTPLAAGGALKSPVAPEGPVQYAALQLMKVAPTPAMLADAEAGIVKATAFNEQAEWPVRVAAAIGAAGMGVISGEELKALFAEAPLDLAEVSAAGDALAHARTDPMADVAAYQSVASMTAPEFLRDKAALIADALDAADTMARAYAAAVLYADDINALQGAIVSPQQAHAFAIARMAVGDAQGAENWLLAMQSGGLGGMSDEESLALIEAVGLLGLLDGAAARRIGNAANIAVETPRAPLANTGYDAGDMAEVVDAVIDAAAGRITGQAALSAIAAADAAAKGDPVASVVVHRGLETAGLADVAGRLAFEQAWSATFAGYSSPPSAGAAMGEQGFAPRLKPSRRQ